MHPSFVLLGLAALTTATPLKTDVLVNKGHATHFPHGVYSKKLKTYLPANATVSVDSNTTTDGHYLSEEVTSRKFFNGTCTVDTIVVRKEWRSLTHTEKTDFVNAELCLMALPGKSGLPGALDRFSDFQAAHQQGTNTTDGDVIHYTAIFLQWHRWQIHLHEQALKTECNFNGTIPWWDEALDAASGNFFGSDMWQDEYFGGNGSSIDNCVRTGPFQNRTIHVGPLETTSDYCFARNWNQTKGLDYGAREHVDDCYAFDDFPSFYSCMAYYPHISGHQATGGVMTDVDSSPGDPVFYLHHNYLDRLYWQWQQINATERLYLIEGNTTLNEPATGWVSLDLDYEMTGYGLTDAEGIAASVAVGQVQNIQGGFLCYEFEY